MSSHLLELMFKIMMENSATHLILFRPKSKIHLWREAGSMQEVREALETGHEFMIVQKTDVIKTENRP